MSKEMSVIALGLWVLVLPYLGIYRSWLTVLMVLTGLALMIIGFLLRGETINKEQQHPIHPKAVRRPRKSHATFEESAPAIEREFATQEHSTSDSLN